MENTKVTPTAQDIAKSLGSGVAKQGKMAAIRAISDYVHGFDTAEKFNATVAHVRKTQASPATPAGQQEFNEAFLRMVEIFLDMD